MIYLRITLSRVCDTPYLVPLLKYAIYDWISSKAYYYALLNVLP